MSIAKALALSRLFFSSLGRGRSRSDATVGEKATRPVVSPRVTEEPTHGGFRQQPLRFGSRRRVSP
jgi:hypothetical protein